ncbi:MAG: AAA family ATPase [Planctomycetes bacterium]|nr:AAA family ATPase [Planctomycetota bacterium]
MKLRRLEIENYGLFSGAEFDFNDGFQLIFGLNEAGKSTLLQAIREVLFGFPTRSRYAFASHAGEMAATASLDMNDGTQLRYRRRKGRKNEVVGKTQPTGHDLDAGALSRLLGGANLELYEQVFGFSLAELASGEKSLQQANLNEALYGGSLGGLANFQKVQSDLKDEADGLFTTRGTTKTINRLHKTIKNTATEQRKATIKPTEYKKQVAACDEITDRVEQLRVSLDNLQTRETHLERIANALTPWLQLQTARRELAELDVPAGFPPDAADQLARLKTRCDELTDELATFEQDLTEQRGELAEIELNPEVVAAEEQIRSLNQQVGEIAGFRRDVPVREAESKATKSQVLTKLRELNPEWDHSHLERFRTGLDQRQSVEQLDDQWSKLTQGRAKLTARRPGLKDDISRHREQLAELQDTETPERLEAIVEAEAGYRANLSSLGQLQEEAGRLTRETQKLIDRLNGPLQTQLDFSEHLPVPLEASVVEFQHRCDDAQEAVRLSKDAVDQVSRELRERQQELDQLDAREPVPDRQQLMEQRDRRDQGWDIIRRKYVETKTVGDDEVATWAGSETASPADEYEQAVVRADAVADERQDKAQSAAERDQLTRSVARLAERVEEAGSQLANSETAADAIQAEWTALWDACPFQPLTPGAMLQWLRQYEELEKKQEQLAHVAQEQSRVESEIDSFETQLRSEFPESTDTTKQLLTLARKAVKTAHDNEAKRQTYEDELKKNEKELERLEKELGKLAEQEAAWQDRWQAVLAEFGFPTSWDVGVATKILSGLSEARSEYESTASLDERVRAMRDGIQEFEQTVAALCQTLASDLVDRPPEFAVEQFGQRLETARQSQQAQTRLTGEIEKLARRVETKRTQLEKARADIQALFTVANVETESQFQQLAAEARQKGELDQVVSDAERELNIHRSTEPEDEFQAELKLADADSIAVECRRLEEEIRTAKAAYDALLREKVLADKARTDMEAASEAAGLAMDLESARSELVTAVDRWAPLVLAQALMRRAIDKFEREHQPAMLGEVERLFRRLTLERYVGIETKLDAQGTLMVVEQDGNRKEPAALSTGTREQLYLAIRLAYITHYCRDAESLPIVMDDVLVNFDDDRAVQTLEVLQEIAANVQILFLTCHQHVVQLVQRIRPDSTSMTLATE